MYMPRPVRGLGDVVAEQLELFGEAVLEGGETFGLLGLRPLSVPVLGEVQNDGTLLLWHILPCRVGLECELLHQIRRISAALELCLHSLPFLFRVSNKKPEKKNGWSGIVLVI